jgi:hypothetical protein
MARSQSISAPIPSPRLTTPRLAKPSLSTGLAPSLLVAALAFLSQGAQAQGLAPMMGANAIQGSLQGASMPTYSGALDKARTTVGMASSAQAGGGAAAATGAPTGGSGSAAQAGPNLASGAPSGASVNGQRIPLCSHGGPCQGAMLRAMGQQP